jgi:Uma2 family endonuclease
MPPTDPLAQWPTDPWAPARPPGHDDLPYDDGEPMESPVHRRQMHLLCECAERGIASELAAFVGGNMGVYYTSLQAVKNDFKAPDFFVVLHAEPRERRVWVTWEEGRGPDLVVEILSPSTEKEDRGRRMRIYAEGIRVSEYYLYDPVTHALEGYRRGAAGGYEPMEREADGGFQSALTGLRLVVAPGTFQGDTRPWLRFAYADGTVVPTAEELAGAEKARADAEKARADAEKARAEALAERLRALGIDPEG